VTNSCCAEVPELAEKLASPEYVAVSVLEPTVADVNEQLVAGRVATQLAPAPSLTVTVPVSIPPPGAFGAMLKLTFTGCPTTTGFGETEGIVVVVLALLTSCVTAPEALPKKLPPPP
jgi:hypothetical protein